MCARPGRRARATSAGRRLRRTGATAARSSWSRTMERRASEDRQGVLQLVAEAERAARLVERGPPPDAARQRLVEQPAVHDQIHPAIGRADGYRAEQLVPEAAHSGQRRLDGRRIPEALDQRADLREIVHVADHAEDHAVFGGSEIELNADRAARIVTGADAVREVVAPERGRPGQRAVAADELGAIPGEGSCRADSHERSSTAARFANSWRKRLVATTAPVSGSVAGHDVDGRARAVLSQHPIDVEGHRQPARRRAGVLEREAEDLRRDRRAARRASAPTRSHRGRARRRCTPGRAGSDTERRRRPAAASPTRMRRSPRCE